MKTDTEIDADVEMDECKDIDPYFMWQNNMDKRIVDFLSEHHVATLATIRRDCTPFCCNIFYAYDSEKHTFIFSSDSATAHVSHFTINDRVAASVVVESKTIGRLQGSQLTGRIIKPEGQILTEARKHYLKRFPFAIAMPIELWIMTIETVKHTDNKLGFGKKLMWDRYMTF